MTKSSKRENANSPKPVDNDPKDKPPRDTREKPVRNPEGPSGLPASKAREDVEAVRPNLKR
jgi:hypothetical protein